MDVYTVTLLNYSTSKDTVVKPITRVFTTYELAYKYVEEKYKDLQSSISISYHTSDERGVLDAELKSDTKTYSSAFHDDYESHWKAFIKLQTLKSE